MNQIIALKMSRNRWWRLRIGASRWPLKSFEVHVVKSFSSALISHEINVEGGEGGGGILKNGRRIACLDKIQT